MRLGDFIRLVLSLLTGNHTSTTKPGQGPSTSDQPAPPTTEVEVPREPVVSGNTAGYSSSVVSAGKTAPLPPETDVLPPPAQETDASTPGCSSVARESDTTAPETFRFSEGHASRNADTEQPFIEIGKGGRPIGAGRGKGSRKPVLAPGVDPPGGLQPVASHSPAQSPTAQGGPLDPQCTPDQRPSRLMAPPPTPGANRLISLTSPVGLKRFLTSPTDAGSPRVRAREERNSTYRSPSPRSHLYQNRGRAEDHF